MPPQVGSRQDALADLALDRRNLRRFDALVLDGLRRLGLDRLGRFLVGHALLEGLDALGDVAHQLGNLAASEQQHDDDAHDDPMPDAYATHTINSRYRTPPVDGCRIKLLLARNLCVRCGKNKNLVRIDVDADIRTLDSMGVTAHART